MDIIENCKYCGSFDIEKVKDIYTCSDCTQTYTTSSKRLSTKSKPFNNKKMHFSNVMRQMSYNIIIDKNYEEFEELLAKNNLERRSLTTTIVYEFLKDKGIKNYRQTFALMNKSSDSSVSFNTDDTITNISILFEDFIKFLYKNGYKRTISYGFIIDRMLEVLNITSNLKPNYTKSNKRDDKSELWNNYVIDLCNRPKTKTIPFIFIPNNKIENEFYFL